MDGTQRAELHGLDHRRRWARARAPVWFVFGALTMGLGAAAIALLTVAAVARMWSWVAGTKLIEVPVWDSAGPVAVGFVAVVVAAAIATALVHGLRGASRRVLRDVGAIVVDPRAAAADSPERTLGNVVEALAIGLGVAAPEVAIVHDDAPNALSVRWGRHRVVVATTGLLRLPRQEVEAVCAHEMAHLHAADARWISAAEATLGRAKTYGLLVAALGVLVVAGSLQLDVLPSVILFGAALGVIGVAAAIGIGHAQRRIRTEADTVADVVAVLLARNPASLGAACDALAADVRVVRRTSFRAEHAWFALVPDDAVGGHSASRRPPQRDEPDDPTAAELRRRSRAAYATAGVPLSWTAEEQPAGEDQTPGQAPTTGL